jgi:tripartite-type tricarboxylate transporter receptor subunit TctC
MILRRLLLTLAPLLLAAGTATAQSFPAKPLTLIVPFPAGGPSDALARALAQGMAADLKQTVVVENIGGASGTIGLTKLVNATGDGYTIGFGTIGTHVANAALFKKLPYDPLTGFEPIGLAGTAPLLLVAKASLPVSNLKEFIVYAEKNKAGMTYGSAGVGSISHYGCVVLLSALKLNITHVPYRGVAPAMNDLMGGHIDFMCDQTTTALPQIAGGKIRALSVLSDQPLRQLPGVATAASQGYDVNLRSWNALFAPKGTPQTVMARLNQALRAAVADPALVKQMSAVGVDLPSPDALQPATVTALIARGLEKDVPALKARGEYLD